MFCRIKVIPPYCMMCSILRRSYKSHAGKVAVAMSGGIDSAVTAMILKDFGFDCIGVYMKNWDNSDEAGGEVCPNDMHREHMEEVCMRLQIESCDVSFIREYWTDVFVPFLESYKSGRETPNPDVYCNRFIKFSKFRDFAFEKLGVDMVATGHYARTTSIGNSAQKNATFSRASIMEHYGIGRLEWEPVDSEVNESSSSSPRLLRAFDDSKDQSYFLSMTKAASLQRVLFPLGELRKVEVKMLASKRFAGLSVLSKRESVGLCFIGKRDMPSFLGSYIPLTPGRFIDADSGRCVGRHAGLEALTLGQGAKIGGASNKYFVISRNPRFRPPTAIYPDSYKPRNTLAVEMSRHDDDEQSEKNEGKLGHQYEYQYETGDVFVSGNDHPALVTTFARLRLEAFSWVSGCPPEELTVVNGTLECEYKLRYRSPVEPCIVCIENGIDMIVTFASHAQRAVSEGQILALYRGDECLGGGPIALAGKDVNASIV